MEFEDSRNALFAEPNAYIQHIPQEKEENHPKKIIFQEPYECLPDYHIKNDFKKGNCSFMPKPKPKSKPKFPFNIDLKALLPIFGALGKGGGIGNIASLLTQFGKTNENHSNSEQGEKSESSGLMSLLSNPSIINTAMSFFKGNTKKPKDVIKKETKSSDLEIKNYTRVE